MVCVCALVPREPWGHSRAQAPLWGSGPGPGVDAAHPGAVEPRQDFTWGPQHPRARPSTLLSFPLRTLLPRVVPNRLSWWDPLCCLCPSLPELQGPAIPEEAGGSVPSTTVAVAMRGAVARQGPDVRWGLWWVPPLRTLSTLTQGVGAPAGQVHGRGAGPAWELWDCITRGSWPGSMRTSWPVSHASPCWLPPSWQASPVGGCGDHGIEADLEKGFSP